MKTNVLCLDCWNEGAGSKSFDISKNFIFWNTIAVSWHGGWWQKLYFIVRRNKELYSVLCVMKYWLCCWSLEQSSAHFSFLTNFINLCFISLFSPHVYAIACISLLSFSLFRKLNVSTCCPGAWLVAWIGGKRGSLFLYSLLHIFFPRFIDLLMLFMGFL